MDIAFSKISHIRIERLLFWCQSVLFVVACVAYIYFTALSVTHVVYRQELVVAVQDIESYIGDLETRYLAGATMLSREAADSMGLVELDSIAYVFVEEGGGRLSRRE